MRNIFDKDKREEDDKLKHLKSTSTELEQFMIEMDTMSNVKTLAQQALGDASANKLVEQKLLSEKLANTMACHPVIYARLSIIIDEILKGNTTFQICTRYASEWNLKYTTIQQLYIPKAKKILKLELEANEEQIYEDIISKYNNLYKIAMRNRDYKEAKFILDSISRYTSIINKDGQVKTAPITTIRLIAGNSDNAPKTELNE